MLTQAEVEYLLQVLKSIISSRIIPFPGLDQSHSVEVASYDGRERFIIDINRKGSIKPTKFLDRHNDHIQIYVKRDGDRLLLTDDGNTLSDLELSGVDLSSSRRAQVLTTILNGLGGIKVGNSLTIEATNSNFPQRKHQLIQAIINVNDMFMTSHSRVAGFFLEDVESFLIKHEIRYISGVQFTWKSGFVHNFDFVIPGFKQKPEQYVQAVNNPSKDKAKIILFSWDDIRETRKGGELVVFLNNSEYTVRQDVRKAFQEYGVRMILWTERDQHVSELSA